MRYVVLVLVAMGWSCNDGYDISCDPPDHTTYRCAPLAAPEANSCIGGPTWHPSYDSATSAIAESPGVAFPDGCTVQLPECNCCYGSPRTLHCRDNQWIEPL